MSELKNKLSQPDATPEIEKRSSNPAVMLITMLLLISALVLTGILMLNQVKTNNPELAEKADGTTETSLAQQAKAFLNSVTTNATSDPVKESATGGDGFSIFGSRDGHVRWPRMKLTGYGTRPDGSGGFAIINGHQYQIGQTISGKVKLVDVREYDVLVEYMGETNSLIVDVNN